VNAVRHEPPVSVDVIVESALWEEHSGLEALVRHAVAAAFEAGELEALPDAELAVLLADDARVQELNREWRKKDQPTNVLSFPAADPDEIAAAPHLGDLALAYETLVREADSEGKSFTDHLTHLVIHGTLHIFGYDHGDDVEAEIMENCERAALARLGIADPYKETSRL
jgi:probable rRNA maturation factor